MQQLVNGTDPGIVLGATGESTLDVEWSGAVAKGAKIILVVTKTTATTFGGQLSDSYIVDNKFAPVASGSYGSCEAILGTAGNATLNGIYQQGAAEGISMFDSAGDQGSTGCDSSAATPPNPARYGLQVNGWASSPYVTAVGGTDFSYYPLNNTSTYWNSTNNSTTGATAKGYIPEVPWNSTCTSSWLLAGSFFNLSTSEAICAYASETAAYFGLDRVTAGSGGVSACTTITDGELSTCSGGYDKPSWQQNLTLPDGKRDLPDVSLFASGGWAPTAIDGSAYLFCLASNSTQGCDYSDPSYIIYQETGGTSVVSPAMAGIMALVLQKMGGKAQGLANSALYSLAAKQNYANCNTNSVSSGNSCVFYDITTGTNAMACVTGSLDCVTPSEDNFGIVSGYNSAVGYDLTTGLGSVNASNLVNNWSLVAAPPAAQPMMTPATGTYTSTQMVTISSATPGATIYYTTDGSVPSRSSPVFNSANPIQVTSSETIKSYAVATGYTLSNQGVATYNIIPPYAATPTFSEGSGFYPSAQTVSISDTTLGAKIHYTTDHTTPTASSPVYGGTPITISITERLQAIAVAPDYSPSAVALSDYYIATAEPVISKPSGTYSGPQMVTITDTTPGAVIYYTTDGMVPDRSSPTISPGGSITVSSSETLKAIAVAAGYTASPQAAAWYTITP